MPTAKKIFLINSMNEQTYGVKNKLATDTTLYLKYFTLPGSASIITGGTTAKSSLLL